jgi:hypothetical protein
MHRVLIKDVRGRVHARRSERRANIGRWLGRPAAESKLSKTTNSQLVATFPYAIGSAALAPNCAAKNA